MNDLDDLKASEFVTDTDDQDSLDERIETEQNLRNQQLWASFQNAACCITKLYKDRAQPNVSLWVPFQNAASNLTTLYKECVDSQRRFAKIGYQIGRKKCKKNSRGGQRRQQSKNQQQPCSAENGVHYNDSMFTAQANNTSCIQLQQEQQLQLQSDASTLAVNQLNLNCDESPSHSMQASAANASINQQHHSEVLENFQQLSNHHQNHHTNIQASTILQHQSNTHTTPLSNNEDNLVTFQQALVQPAVIRSIKSGQNSNNNHSNRSSFPNNCTIDPVHKSEEERLLELNRFLSEEYHRHVGSRKRSCSAIGGNMVKRVRE